MKDKRTLLHIITHISHTSHCNGNHSHIKRYYNNDVMENKGYKKKYV